MARTTAGQHVDVVVADTAAEASGVAAPVVVLAEAPALLSVPALDPLRHNPIGWQRDVDGTVGALGPLDRLPARARADCVVHPADENRIRSLHHLEDVQAFHPDATARAATLVRLAALGAVVHLADEAPHIGGAAGHRAVRPDGRRGAGPRPGGARGAQHPDAAHGTAGAFVAQAGSASSARMRGSSPRCCPWCRCCW